MTGRMAGKVAFVTGAARGQGRSHALRLAEEGADIIALDIAAPIPSLERFYPAATAADLERTVEEIERRGRRVYAGVADVREFDAVKDVVDAGVAALGRLDVVAVNAGIFMFGDQTHEVTESDWDDVQDINVKGAWHTTKATIPHLVDQGEGGAIVITSSVAGLKGTPNVAAYTTSKHAVVGLMRTLAIELAPHRIRVNSVHPTSVATDMIFNDALYRMFLPDEAAPTRDQAEPVFETVNTLPVPWVEPVDVSNAVLWLASDEARYVTGVELPVDAGATLK